MKGLKHYWSTVIFCMSCYIFVCNPGFADDTCMFSVTADDVSPNIVILLDNGAEMEQIVWHSSYDNSTDYTPNTAENKDIVDYGVTGNGFFNDNGYGIVSHGSSYYLVKVLDTLELDDYSNGLDIGSGTYGGLTIPVQPSTSVDGDGVKDNATHYRYSKNYLNWVFFSSGPGSYVDVSAVDDGSDLPTKTRFYYAKKAIMTVAKLTSNKAYFGIYNFTSNYSGASNVQPLGYVVDTPLAAVPANNTLDSSFQNNINNMATVTYSPLAEGLQTVGGYYGSPSSGVVGEYCQKSFVVVVTPGVSSEDLGESGPSYSPSGVSDYDGDNSGIGEGNVEEDNTNDTVDNDTDGTTDEADEAVTYAIPTNQDGTTYLDDVAYYLYTHDIVDYQAGFQNVMTYTIGFMGDQESNLFLINTSNNGNGNVNLYDTTDVEYGKYHFTAESPDALSSTLLAAINEILSATSTFTAPVVPVTRTTSGNRIYMAFFKPGEGIFWEGNVTKFGISSTNQIIGANGYAATWPNGAMKDDALAYWETKHWAADDRSAIPKANGIRNENRNIYTYVGSSTDLTDSANAFTSTNLGMTATVLGNPTHTTTEIINYVRGADVFDEDSDGNTTENREVITGDVLHSEPLVVYYNSSTTMVYFGSNDGMLHAVLDSDGTEAWAFIPSDQLHRLKDMVEGSSHQYYVDSSPKAYITDVNGNGEVDGSDKVILVCGQRKGGTSYFALDVTNPSVPVFKWWISTGDSTFGALELGSVAGTFQDNEALTGDIAGAATVYGTLDGDMLWFDGKTSDFSVGEVVTGGTSGATGTILSVYCPTPDTVVSDLGETWSEPVFGLVKTSGADTAVCFIGGGYHSANTAGNVVLVINVLTGAVVKEFRNDGSDITDMNYSFPSSVCVLDINNNGFVDKFYVGDAGGQMWRFGKFTDSGGGALSFPSTDENITNWTNAEADVLFLSDATHARKFFYPPAVAVEDGYHLVYTGTGDREDACSTTSSDRIYCIKDTHASVTLVEDDLVDVTVETAAPPDLESSTGDVEPNGHVDQGWYIQLAAGEKVLSEGTVFYKTLYTTTFTPNNDPCLPGGVGMLYAVHYLTGAAVLDFDDSDSDYERSVSLGGGIPSKPVMVITESGQKLFISVGSTNPDEDDTTSETFDAGIVAVDPLAPPMNFFYLWWRELIG